MNKIKSILPLAVGVMIGVLWGILSDTLENHNIIKAVNIIWITESVVLGFLIQIIVHESGHLVAGLISGYSFSSFRIGSLTLIRMNGKLQWKKYSIKGTAGQCLMIPPENKGYNYPVVLYNLGGIIMNLIVSCILLILMVIFHSMPLFIIAYIGFLAAIMNGIPMKTGGVANDGMNVRCLKKDPLAMKAMDSQLRVNALLMKGIRLKEMPEEWFEVPENSDSSNINTGTMVYLKITRMLDGQEFLKAKETIQWALQNITGMLQLYQNELKCELIFCNIMTDELEEAKNTYESDIAKYIQQTASWPSRKRLMYAYELLVDKNEAKAKTELEMFEKRKKTYPYEADIKSEEELIGLIQRKAEESYV